MKKTCALLLICFCLQSSGSHAQYGSFDSARTVSPFKIFDNLYYVGIDAVSAYLLVTDDGLILIDALYAKYTNHIAPAIRQLGFDPKNIKYILCTHGHFDHCEGAGIIQELSHARIGMTEPDWQMAEWKIKEGYESVTTKLTRDMVIHDGDSLKLGNTMVRFYETPGHTPGVLSMSFPVKHGPNTYLAFLFGGVGLNFDGVPRTEAYLRSVDRILKMEGIQVNISNHPGSGKIFERANALAKYTPGTQHPFVAPDEFRAWLMQLKKAAEQKLEEEKKKAMH